jgi:hypothetical protein
MLPLMTLMSCGSSSRLVWRSRRPIAEVLVHRAELVNAKATLAVAVAILAEQHRAGRCQLDGDRDDHEQRREEQQHRARHGDIEHAFGERVSRLLRHGARRAPYVSGFGPTFRARGLKEDGSRIAPRDRIFTPQ